MVTDEKFYDAVKFFLNRMVDFRVQIAAMEIVLEKRFPGFQEQAEIETQKLATLPEISELRESIESFHVEDILQVFAKYSQGPIQ